MSIELFVHNEFDISTFESIWESYDKTICNNKLTLFKSILHFSSGDKISSESHFLEAFCHKAILNFDVSEWSSLVWVAAMATVIQFSIHSVYSPRRNVKMFDLFAQKFTPRIKESDKTITLLWSTTEQISEYMKPNHLVVSSERQKISGINFGTVSQDSRA